MPPKDEEALKDPVEAWMSLGFVIGGLFGTVVLHLILEFSRRKPTWKVTVIDSLWVYCCYILLVRIISIHAIWIFRSVFGPLNLSLSYARVMIERITLISGALCGTLSSILRLAYVLAWKTMHDYQDGQILFWFQVIWLGLSGALFLAELGLYFLWFGHYFVGIESEVELLSGHSTTGPSEGISIRLVFTLGFLGACALITLICRGSIYFEESFHWKKRFPPSTIFAHANQDGEAGNMYMIDHGVLEAIRGFSQPQATKLNRESNPTSKSRFPILRLVSNHRIVPLSTSCPPVPKSNWCDRFWRNCRKFLFGRSRQLQKRLHWNILTFSSQVLLTLCLFLTSLLQFVSAVCAQSDIFGIFVVGPLNCSVIIPWAMMSHNPKLRAFALRRVRHLAYRFGSKARRFLPRNTLHPL